MSAREEIRIRCGRAAFISVLVAIVIGFFTGASLLRQLLGPIAALIRAAAWSTALFKLQTVTFTRFSKLINFFKLTTLIPGALAAIAGAVTAWSWLPGPLFGTCKDPNNTCLHEYNLYLLLVGLWNGLYYYITEFVFKTPSIKFPLIEQDKLIRIKFVVLFTFKYAVKRSFQPMLMFVFLYYWKGGVVRNLLRNLFSVPLNDTPLDGIFAILSFPLFFHVWCHTVLFLFMTYFMSVIFNIYLTERLIFPIESSNNNQSLADYISGEKGILAELASKDFLQLSSEDEYRRQLIFSLSIPGGHPTNWKKINSACLEIINSYIEEIDSLTCDIKIETSNLPILKNNNSTLNYEIKSPTLRKLVMTSPKAQINHKYVEDKHLKFKNAVKREFFTFLIYLRNKPGIYFFFGELTDIKVKDVMNRSQLVSRVILGLAHLIYTSIEEDKYGVIQDDLSIIISAMLRLKHSLEKLTKSSIMHKKSVKYDTSIIQLLTEIKSAVKRSLYKITISFGDHIKDILLDSDSQIALQPFINFREG